MPWITRNRSFTCVLYFCSLSVYADNTEQAKDTGHSLVEAEHLEDKPSEVIHFQEKSDNQNIDSNAALMHVPGLTVVDSGPLSRSELHYHGLSNARYRIDLEGLDLNNPMNGMSDANSLFLFAAQQLIAGPQSLSLRLPNPREPVAKALFGYGSLHSFKIGASAGLPLGEYSSAFAAAQMSGSQGDFSFSSPDLPKGPENSFQRRNNDQQRIQALAKIQRQSDSGGAHLLLAVNGHEGGLPGFAFDPKESQRTETWFSGFNAGFNKKHKDVQFFVASSHSLFSYDAQNQAEIIDNFRASVHELSFSLKPLTLPQGYGLRAWPKNYY
jgi:hypothetical protein